MDSKLEQQKFAAEVAGLLDKYGYTGAVVIHFERVHNVAPTMQLIRLVPPGHSNEAFLAEQLMNLNEDFITRQQGTFSSNVKFGYPGNKKVD